MGVEQLEGEIDPARASRRCIDIENIGVLRIQRWRRFASSRLRCRRRSGRAQRHRSAFRLQDRRQATNGPRVLTAVSVEPSSNAFSPIARGARFAAKEAGPRRTTAPPARRPQTRRNANRDDAIARGRMRFNRVERRDPHAPDGGGSSTSGSPSTSRAVLSKLTL